MGNRFRNLTIKDLDDPNRSTVDVNEGDKEFRKLMRKIVFSLKVQHVEPEQIVIRQADNIMNEDVEPVQYYPEKA